MLDRINRINRMLRPEGECWISDVGFWVLGVGCWVLDVGCCGKAGETKESKTDCEFLRLSGAVFGVGFSLK